MTIPPQSTNVTELWDIISKEITGIQLLWESIDNLYFKEEMQGLATLEQDTPMLYHLLQSTLIKSLLMRIARLMDTATSGHGPNKSSNLSLKQLEKTSDNLSTDMAHVQNIWNNSNLKYVRNKYLSHNDLTRLLDTPHTLNIPLNTENIADIKELTSELCKLRCQITRRLHAGTVYLEQSISLQVKREVDTLSCSLQGSELFFKLLPEHEILQIEWNKKKSNPTDKV